MLLMVPIAYISFISFDLISLLTGGFITNFIGLADTINPVVVFLLGAFLGILVICLVPIHWVLINQPGNWIYLLALALPWIVTCFLTSYLFAHTPRGGIHTSLAIGIGFFVLMLVPYILLAILLAQFGGAAIIDGLSVGITDLPWVLATLCATMEGAGVGAFFGAFAGSLKYKPGKLSKKEKKAKKKKKKEKKKKEQSYIPEPTFDDISTSSRPSASTDNYCLNCGTKLLPGDDFCTKCGSKAQ